MKILAIEKEVGGKTKEQFKIYLKPEAQRVWDLYQTGIIREIYFSKPLHNALIILECTNENEAREILNTLPLVEVNLIDFDIIPLVPYDGFSRLFEN
ncbi:MAG: hypothetical protein NTX65_10100 [Ignavibacteriales bacterium]|nr:hypothetical protein [Ignavibacteriales bacterium]